MQSFERIGDPGFLTNIKKTKSVRASKNMLADKPPSQIWENKDKLYYHYGSWRLLVPFGDILENVLFHSTNSWVEILGGEAIHYSQTFNAVS